MQRICQRTEKNRHLLFYSRTPNFVYLASNLLIYFFLSFSSFSSTYLRIFWSFSRKEEEDCSITRSKSWQELLDRRRRRSALAIQPASKLAFVAIAFSCSVMLIASFAPRQKKKKRKRVRGRAGGGVCDWVSRGLHHLISIRHSVSIGFAQLLLVRSILRGHLIWPTSIAGT